MKEKMLGSIHQGITRSSSHQTSMYGSDFLELGWENGQILVKGVSSNRTPHNPSCNIGCSTINTSHKDEAIGTTKRTRLNTLCSLLNDHFPPHKDSDLSSSHSHQTNDQNDLQLLQNNKSFNKLEEEFANIKQPKESTHEFLPSSPPLKKPRMDHSSQAPEANSKKLKYLGNCDQRRTVKVNNFSNFLVPKVFLKKSTQPIRNESLAKLEEIEAAKGSKGLKGFQDQQTSVTANKSNDPVSLVVARSDEEPPLDDENSEAVAILRAKGKANSSLCNEPLLPSSPVWSLEASNDPNFSIKKHEDSDESTYSSTDVTYNDEEAEDVVLKETIAREGSSVKRKRNAETHNSCEKKRRDKMDKKMSILKELIPNCNKVDKVSLLDDAIGYVKSLKLQLQIMSMGSGLCMPQMMLPQLMGAGMGFRPSTGINPWSPPQFPIPALSGIKDNNTFQNMFGSFSNQMPHIPPIPHHVPNFIPMMIGNNSSTQQHMPTTTPTNLPKHLANSSQLTTLDVSDLHAKAELCGTNQAENQAPLNHIPSYPFYFATQLE